MKIKEQIEHLNSLVQSYEATSDNPHLLIELQKELSCHLYYMENQRAKFNEMYQQLVFDLVQNEKKSVASAKLQADVQFPEMYRLRRIMEAAKDVFDAMRTHISFLKAEMHQTKMN